MVLNKANINEMKNKRRAEAENDPLHKSVVIVEDRLALLDNENGLLFPIDVAMRLPSISYFNLSQLHKFKEKHDELAGAGMQHHDLNYQLVAHSGLAPDKVQKLKNALPEIYKHAIKVNEKQVMHDPQTGKQVFLSKGRLVEMQEPLKAEYETRTSAEAYKNRLIVESILRKVPKELVGSIFGLSSTYVDKLLKKAMQAK
ncbi:MAG: hypothetical protein WC408_02720 [Candidatus Micrarchaeia archaeon]|jgi:hypothetical protein